MVEVREDRAFDVEVLENSFDHDVRLLDGAVDVGDRNHPAQGELGILLRKPAFLDPAGEVFQVGYRYADGMLHLGDEPGIGVTIDEEAAARYPYQPKYLPVNRLRDGSMHDW